jgi:hypothetical protein
MVSKKIKIKKESGNYQDFSRIKFINSLKRSGIDSSVAEAILKQIGPRLKEGLSTRRLYRMAHRLIRQRSQKAASRYALPRALLALGPDGFNFERFMGEIMSKLGYKVDIGMVLQGRCVSHEVDVIATKPGKTIYMECKFHNDLGFKEDVKTALYVNARNLDLAANEKNDFQEFWLVTNSKATTDAQTYASCAGLKIVTPYSPEKNSIYEMIVQANAHPINCLSNLRKQDQAALVSHGILFVKDLVRKPKVLDKMGFNEKRKEQLIKEARIICSPF